MKVRRAHIRNYRLLEDASIAFDDTSTMIVGRNNSGKTSVVEIFRKLAKADPSAFTFDDLSLAAHPDFQAAHEAYDRWIAAKAAGDDAARELEAETVRGLPAIELTLTIEYSDVEDLTPLAPVILDLDPDRRDATLVYRTFVKDPFALFDGYEEANKKKPVDLFVYLRKRFSSITSSTIEAVDVNDPSNTRTLTDADVRRVLSIKFIYAQNQIDDLSSDSSHRLSKGFEDFYRSNEVDNATVEGITDLLEAAGTDLDKSYGELFKAIYDDLGVFGVGRMPGLPKLSVVAELEAVRVLRGSTRLYYNDDGATKQLPEAHNGLGYSKLIFTILQFISFYEELRRAVPRPPMQLIFVEEPEAHLHPQMQYVFVKNIRQFVADKADWNAQTVITTHSSHMIAESGFDCIRYFDNSVAPMRVRDLSVFRTEQLRTTTGTTAVHFLEQYMVLNRCDMFFADKLILIEGTVERLLLPEMIAKVAPNLAHQYLSIIEVGGAYAHLFRGIVEFLNVQTLVITDIDAIDPATRRATRVAMGAATSNQTLINWLPAKTTIDDLLAVPADAKVRDRVAIAYQIPERGKVTVGRSFEEAFILSNSEVLETTASYANKVVFQGRDAAAIEASSYGLSRDIDKKTDFAFDILQMTDWSVPRYIKEGLEWLNT